MVLFDTENNIIVSDAIELIPGIWVHQDYRHICTDAQIGELGSGKRYALLSDDSPIGKERTELEKTLLPAINQNGSVVLPEWLNEWIKGEDAFYEVDREQIKDGRELIDYGIRWYLGSYFPKSFAEAYIIFSDLFSNSSYKSIIQEKEELSVLDIGCGTGGDTIGLISAIITSLPKIKKIKVLACDYCEEALLSLSKLILFFNRSIGKKVVEIDLTTKTTAFATKTTSEEVSLKDFAESLSDKRFDIILSFKIMCVR